jgi:hypothetical protein
VYAARHKDFTRETVKRSDRETVRFVVDVREKNAITERATTCSTAYKAPTGRRTTAAEIDAESPRRHLQSSIDDLETPMGKHGGGFAA